MQSFMCDVSWTEGVKLSIKLCDLRWGEEVEVAGEKMMAVSKSDKTFSHFGCKTALEHTFALAPFKRVNLEQQLENKVFVDKGFPVFYFFLCPQDALHLLYYVVFIRRQHFTNNFECLAQFDIRNGVDWAQSVRNGCAWIKLISAIQKEEYLIEIVIFE